MAITFTEVDKPEQLDADALLAEHRKRVPIEINTALGQHGSLTFKKKTPFRGSFGGGIVTKILNAYFTRLLADGATIEAANCVKSQLDKLNNYNRSQSPPQ